MRIETPAFGIPITNSAGLNARHEPPLTVSLIIKRLAVLVIIVEGPAQIILLSHY